MQKSIETTGYLWIDGSWVLGATKSPVLNKYNGFKIADVHVPDQMQVNKTVIAAKAAFKNNDMEPYERSELLLRVRDYLSKHSEQIIEVMLAESGFTLSDVTGEFNRTLQTLRLSAEEATRIHGDVVPIDGAKGQGKRFAFTTRKPVGVVCAITPFNSPLNTVCHKIAPAFAAGNAVILKPSLHTPLSSEFLCKAFEAAGIPKGMMSILHGPGETVGEMLLRDQSIDYYTFTGSTRVGEIIQRHAGLRRTQLELGNISGTIVCADSDLQNAVTKCVNASFRKAGQVCTSVQRLYIQNNIFDTFVDAFVEKTMKLKVGDPRDPETDVGPMISEAASIRADAWIAEAQELGATLHCGGQRDGAVFQPSVLSDVDSSMRVVCEEIFAPVVTLMRFDDVEDAIRQVDSTPFGLAAGIFTSNIEVALGAAKKLRVGTLHINETSSSRVDQMPYGGVKQSGFGQEGPKYAIRDMTEEQLVTIVPVS